MKFDDGNAALSHNLPDGGSAQFTIAATSHAFQILSSSIYEHKIAAVVREICTNAYDSHREAGKEDVPFRVNLPTEFHPYFEVEDFGVGMSVADAVNVYTVYFASTKRETNEVAGGIGIGGKSIFAYTKQFNIRIRKDGVENLAIIHIGSEGFPQMNIIATTNTSEPNGVKVSIPIAKEDFYKFIAEAMFYLSFYSTPPKINMELDFSFKNAGASLRSKGYAFVQENTKGNKAALQGGGFYAVMGPVPYKVSVLSLIEDRNARKLLETATSRNGALFVEFGIGDLSVAASRETLSMDEKTREAVTLKFLEIAERSRKELVAKANDITKHPLELLSEFRGEFGEVFFSMIPDNSRMMVARRKLVIPRLRIWESARRRNPTAGIGTLPYDFSMDSFQRRVGSSEVPARILMIDTGKPINTNLVQQCAFDYIYKGDMSDLRCARLERIFNTKIERISYHAMYLDLLAERRKNRAKSVRNSYAKENIPASGWVLRKTPEGWVHIEEFSSRTDLDTVVLCGEWGAGGLQGHITKEGCFSKADLCLMMEAIVNDASWEAGKTLKFVRVTKQNIKRLMKYPEAYDVAQYLKQFVADNSEAIAAQLSLQYVSNVVKNVSKIAAYGTNHSIDMALRAGFYDYLTDATKSQYETLLEIEENLQETVASLGGTSYNTVLEPFRQFLKDDVSGYGIAAFRGEISEIKSKLQTRIRDCAEVSNLLENRYPLIENTIWSVDNELIDRHVRNYVKMVNAEQPDMETHEDD